MLDMTTFDVILGMDWLARYKAIIDCSRRQVTVSGDNTAALCAPSSGSGVLLSALYTVDEVSPVRSRGLPRVACEFPEGFS